MGLRAKEGTSIKVLTRKMRGPRICTPRRVVVVFLTVSQAMSCRAPGRVANAALNGYNYLDSLRGIDVPVMGIQRSEVDGSPGRGY